MAGYAPNPSASDASQTASLTAGLLARKGEALPAVDAQVFAGVDIDTQVRPATPRGGASPETLNRKAVDSLYRPAEPTADRSQASSHSVPQSPQWRPTPSPSRSAMTITPPTQDRKSWLAGRKRKSLASLDGPKAVVTYRMSINEFVRLRRAASELDMTCQEIILDALDCYLDANEIDTVSMDEARAETAALARRRKAAKSR